MDAVIDRVFTAEALLVALLIGLGGGVLALIVRLILGHGTAALLRALETLITGFLGAFLAHGFIGLMLLAGGDSHGAQVVTSLFFFIWPGVVNLLSWAFGEPLIGVHGLQVLALIVGGAVGVYDGLWASHKWLGLGLIGFPLDVTWGLAGSTDGVLLHLINTYWGKHRDDAPGAPVAEARQGAHLYRSGFRLKTDFAFTQGAVMSDMTTHGPTDPLFAHESIHVWQNRVLGPFFTFSYFGWMVLTFIPALIAGLIDSQKRVGAALEAWTYYDNPWEVMAYGIANPTSRIARGSSGDWLYWPWAIAIIFAVPGLFVLGLLFVLIFAGAYG